MFLKVFFKGKKIDFFHNFADDFPSQILFIFYAQFLFFGAQQTQKKRVRSTNELPKRAHKKIKIKMWNEMHSITKAAHAESGWRANKFFIYSIFQHSFLTASFYGAEHESERQQKGVTFVCVIEIELD